MLVTRICVKCGAEYQIEKNDEYEICHECYLDLDKQYKQYKKDFKNTHDKGCEPVCFNEYYNNEFLSEV